MFIGKRLSPVQIAQSSNPDIDSLANAIRKRTSRQSNSQISLYHTCSGFLPSNKPCINHQVQLYCSSYFPDLDQKALLASASMIF